MDLNARNPLPALSESDLALIDVMQEDPRAPWAQIGQAIGVSAPTARRRWGRLLDGDAAWVTTHAGWNSGVVTAIVAVQCRPGTVENVIEAFVRHPRVVTIAEITGDHDLMLTVLVPDVHELRRFLRVGLTSHADVVRLRTMLVTRMFLDGSHWRSGFGVASRHVQSREGSTSPAAPLTPALATAISILERNGRAPSSELAEALGVSEAYARRFVRRAVRSGQIVQRIDVQLEQPRWPYSLVLWMVVPAGRLYAAAARISGRQSVRACAALAGGSANLYAIVWLSSLAEAPEVEMQIVQDSDVRVVERSIMLHYSKRMGHVFDAEQRRTGHVPWVDGMASANPAGDPPATTTT
ncbi:AsnC family transcriptional regulator [Pseudoclavibacter helvolus]|uniref:AsnC family transcriptional regulator n=1 Tax=Pseudoclavibacter helvolus TaxID=255205 RepID=UPI003C77A18D